MGPTSVGTTAPDVANRSTMKTIAIIIATSMFIAATAYAGCKSDCRDEYESEISTCQIMHDGPDDADDLVSCIESARSDYESCVDDCNN